MKLSLTVAVICTGIFLFMACKKDDTSTNNSNNNNNNTTLSAKAQTLIAGKWQMTAATATTTYMGKDTTFNIYADMEDCDKDDFMQFASGGTCTIDENANKCSKDNQVESAKWTMLNTDTRLALVDDNPDTFDITELTGTQMKWKITKLNSSNVPVITSYTFKNIK